MIKQQALLLDLLLPPGPPDPPERCAQYNHSSDAVHIACEPGYDGGMDQVGGTRKKSIKV